MAVSSHAYSNEHQTLNPFSDEQLGSIYAQGSQNILSYFEIFMSDSHQKSYESNRIVNSNELNMDVIDSLTLSEIHTLALVQSLQKYQAKVSIQGKQMMIQMKEIHIPIVEVDMNIQGLYLLIDPIGLSTQFVTSSLSR